MNQLFYNIAGGIVHQIRRKKQTTISEVIIRGKRNLKQNRSVSFTNFLLKARVLFYKPVSHLFGFTSVFLSKFVAFHPRTVKRIVAALMQSLLFRCFSRFLPHLRTQAKRSQNCEYFSQYEKVILQCAARCSVPLTSRGQF